VPNESAGCTRTPPCRKLFKVRIVEQRATTGGCHPHDGAARATGFSSQTACRRPRARPSAAESPRSPAQADAVRRSLERGAPRVHTSGRTRDRRIAVSLPDAGPPARSHGPTTPFAATASIDECGGLHGVFAADPSTDCRPCRPRSRVCISS
jgi:hypothetical protein